MTKTLAGIVLCLASGSAFAQEDVFILYSEDRIGSHMRIQLGEFPVPLNKPYHEMDELHQQIIRADYGDMSADTQPPFPKLGLEEFFRPLLQANVTFNDKGELMAIATVDKKGKVANVSLYKTPSRRIGEMAGRLMMLTEFEPGRCSGKPCNGEFLLELNFEP